MAHNILTTLTEEFSLAGLEEVPDLIAVWYGRFREGVEMRIASAYPKLESGKALVEGLWLRVEDWVESVVARILGKVPWTEGRWTTSSSVKERFEGFVELLTQHR